MLEKMEAGHDPVEEANALLKRHRDGRKEARRNAGRLCLVEVDMSY